jgi:GDP-D-mannose 3', 5'-epimerase
VTRVLVAGAGGFIGGYLVNDLIENGFTVRAVDRKDFTNWYQVNDKAENLRLDLQNREACKAATDGVNHVYNLAADMGGMGFIEKNKALCMLSVLINTHLLQESLANKVTKYFFSSSACIYPSHAQTQIVNVGLLESDAYPAMPEDGYGWEKLFSERMCRHFFEDFGLETRIARFHNVYGPHGTWRGGREKAPAAICRKVAEAKLSGGNEIEIWGDGNQGRSFMWIDDCIKGIGLLMNSSFREPINLGSDELVSINQLVSYVEDIAGLKLNRVYKLDAPQGVRGRNSDNTLIHEVFGWAPDTNLRIGLEKTYAWIYNQLKKTRF